LGSNQQGKLRAGFGLLAVCALTVNCGDEPQKRRRPSNDAGDGGSASGAAGCGGPCAGKGGGGAAGAAGVAVSGQGGTSGASGASGGAVSAGSAGKATTTGGASGSGGQGGSAGDAGGKAGGGTSAGDGGANTNAGSSGMASKALTIEKVAIYQATEVTLFEGGDEPELNAPIIADRAAELRVFVRRSAGFAARDIAGVLTFTGKNGTLTLSEVLRVSGDSTSASLDSTLNFSIPAADLGEDNSLRLELREEDASAGLIDAWPASGAADVPGSSPNGALRLTLVPLVTRNFVPDLSTTVVENFRSHLEALYPITSTEIKVHAPEVLSTDVIGDDYGTGWEEALIALYELRYRDEPPPNEYYYGVLTPGEDMNDYCPTGCVVGLSVLAGRDEEEYRGAIGTGFFDFAGDTFSQETLEHELGHALGRDHAPCDTQDPDRGFPYSDGHIGVWGWDGSMLRNPSQDADVMSYCIPVWVSDYTFDALFTRIAYVNGLSQRSVERSTITPKRARTLVVKSDGSLRWGSERNTRRSFDDASEQVDLLDSGGRVVGSAPARFAPFSHLPGGFLSVPAEALGSAGVVAVRVRGTTMIVP
jgi:hypothetical protein